MKAIILILAGTTFFNLTPIQQERETEKRVVVTGTVTQSRKYCGGARPTDEIMAQLNKPRPVANKKIYIKKGEVNHLNSRALLMVVTDSLGRFSVKLKPGKYLVVDSTKSDMKYYNHLRSTYEEQTQFYDPTDTTCLIEWYKKPVGVFEVGKNNSSEVNINFHLGCKEDLPCTRFRGPFRQ